MVVERRSSSFDSAALRRTMRMATGRKAILEENELCSTLF
jgi:hypothetical protein